MGVDRFPKFSLSIKFILSIRMIKKENGLKKVEQRFKEDMKLEAEVTVLENNLIGNRGRKINN
jgi:hypothetical protein